MFCIYVEDLEAWWSKIREIKVNDSYGDDAKILAEPHQQEGGLMMQFTDPTGVLWHVREGE
ncbi:MAG: VOC family protein [Cocleimonas sp.]